MTDAQTAITHLIDIMARLRDPVSGCPWDQVQDFATIAPYTIEEAYEVEDAIAQGNPATLLDELGDLLFQVVYHARMAEERGWFAFADVAVRRPGASTVGGPRNRRAHGPSPGADGRGLSDCRAGSLPRARAHRRTGAHYR